MGKSKTRHTRKRRRLVKAVLNHGPESRPSHRSRGGRTGNVRSSRLKEKSVR